MAWIEVSLELKGAQIEQASTLLESLGALAITLYDAHDNPILEPPPLSDPKYWEDSILVALMPEHTEVKSLEAHLRQVFPTQGIESKILEDKNWVEESQKNFPVFSHYPLWIGASWHPKPEDPLRKCIVLDPGMAFGTGSHATTSMCLEQLVETDLLAKTVVDYGCGSGILSMAASILGAHQVHGIDYDPQALQASEQNSTNNDFKNIRFYSPELFKVQNITADVLVANIILKPLLELKQSFERVLPVDGILIVSGLLITQCDALKEHYQNYEWIRYQQKDDWCCLVGRRTL